MIVIVYVVGGLVIVLASLVGGTGIATMLLPFVIAAMILAVFGVLLLLWRLATLQRMLAEVRGAQSVAVTDPGKPPAAVAALIGELRRLGFEVIVAMDTVVGGSPPIRTWVMTESEGAATTWIEVVGARAAMAIFLSRGVDGRFLETAYPEGASLDHPSVLARRIQTSLDDALREHRVTLDEWAARAGLPLVVRTLEDYRHVETELRERTGGMRIAAYLERAVVPSLRHWAINAVIAMITFFTIAFLPITRF